MKRLLPAVICALALHAIILSSDFSWLKQAPGATPVSRSLSITLSANTFQKHKEAAAVEKKEPENRLQPDLQQKPKEEAAGIPAATRLENSAQIQKQLPARTLKKPRPKKNLKALTREFASVKARETARGESIDADVTSPAVHAKAFSPVSPTHPTGHDLLAPEMAFIKKTSRMAGEHSESTTYSAALASRQSDNGAPASAITLAKPLYRQNPAPAYPRKARRLGYEGMVMLKVLVDENGRVDDLTVLESSGHTILDQTALASVRKWLFEPGTEGGIRTKMWVRVPIRFDLE